ncbi:hypothetical protein IJ732_03495 [bacterium]|nr:hypothetical protein [bacterium]
MNLITQLKKFEGNYAFIRWTNSEEYGKLSYVGSDFIQFDIINVTDMEYYETAFIKSHLIQEVLIGGADISRIIAEVSSKLTDANR